MIERTRSQREKLDSLDALAVAGLDGPFFAASRIRRKIRRRRSPRLHRAFRFLPLRRPTAAMLSLQGQHPQRCCRGYHLPGSFGSESFENGAELLNLAIAASFNGNFGWLCSVIAARWATAMAGVGRDRGLCRTGGAGAGRSRKGNLPGDDARYAKWLAAGGRPGPRQY